MTDTTDPQGTETERPWWAAPVGAWTDRVAYSRGGQFAYRPHEVIVHGRDASERAVALAGELSEPDGDVRVEDLAYDYFLVSTGTVDAQVIVAELIAEGIRAEPNVVLFADQTGAGGVEANPVYANPVYANPVYANPVYANPVYANGFYASTTYANPVYASPVYANPVYANPVYAWLFQRTGRRTSSARPADPVDVGAGHATPGPAQVLVLDTGLAAGPERPALLARLDPSAFYDVEGPDEQHDLCLDPCAGHGTFAAGILEQMLPGVPLGVGRVLSTFGDGDEARIGERINMISQQGFQGIGLNEYTIINLSFGGYATENMAYLARVLRRVQLRGVVVVASAGNDASWRPSYPACLEGVISVGALGTGGPAAFTNYGPWVRACAPGVDLVSSFFTDFDGSLRPLLGGPDPDHFEGWARWSGTSFSAPLVAGALANEINRTGCTAREAVEHLIDAPGLFQLPGLGTVVNLMGPGRPVIP